MNKTVLASFEISCLLSTVFLMGLALNIQTVKASGTIYIRADGSVDPPTAPILTVDNVTFTLSGNINATIVVERNNIVIDGAGYAIEGEGSGKGIDLTKRTNVTIKNMEIKAFLHGVYLWYSAGNVISGNKITANTMSGVKIFRFSAQNTISGNDITNNGNGIGIVDSPTNRIYGNNIQGNHLGIEFYRSSNNLLYHNNFVNPNQIYGYLSENVWDDGYPSGGNYWGDYSGSDVYGGPYQDETGYDWIGDASYVIDERNQDNYPLMYPFVAEMEEIRTAYRNLLLRHSELLSDFEELNSTLYILLINIADLQGRYDSLLSRIDGMQEQVYSVSSTCEDQGEYIDVLQGRVDLLNLTLRTSVSELQEKYDLLNSTLTSGQGEITMGLNIIRNIMYLFIATMVILVATTVYLAMRKPKSQH